MLDKLFGRRKTQEPSPEVRESMQALEEATQRLIRVTNSGISDQADADFIQLHRKTRARDASGRFRAD